MWLSSPHAHAHHALPEGCDYFFIENVGNLVCPAIYDLGQHANAVVLSVTEGVDKPLKYPVMFRNAELVVLTKVDLLPHLPGVSIEAFEQALATVMPKPKLLQLSAVTGQGVPHWLTWLEELRGATGVQPSTKGSGPNSTSARNGV